MHRRTVASINLEKSETVWTYTYILNFPRFWVCYAKREKSKFEMSVLEQHVPRPRQKTSTKRKMKKKVGEKMNYFLQV